MNGRTKTPPTPPRIYSARGLLSLQPDLARSLDVIHRRWSCGGLTGIFTLPSIPGGDLEGHIGRHG